MMDNITQESFSQIVSLIKQIVGIKVPEDHFTTVLRSMEKRYSELGINGDEYFSILRSNSKEQEKFINGITINETYFFREEKQFKVLKEFVFPKLMSAEPLNIWSATCSTGEEAVSLALLAHKFFGEHRWNNVSIYATDINTEALDILRKGEYLPRSFKTDGESFRYLAGIQNGEKRYTISDSIKKQIIISRLNLFKDMSMDFPDELDVIFFRNTLIYYDMDVKTNLLAKIISRLKPGGVLFVSATEVPFVPLEGLKLLEHNNIFYFLKLA